MTYTSNWVEIRTRSLDDIDDNLKEKSVRLGAW